MSVLINSSTLPSLALSSSAGFLLAGGSVAFVSNLVGGVGRYIQQQSEPAYGEYRWVIAPRPAPVTCST